MANTKRPTLTPKPPTKKATAKRESVLNKGMRIVIEDVAYEVRYGDISPAVSRELRAVTGYGWMGLQQELSKSGPEPDLLQAFMWLSRRIKGEQVELEDVVVDYDVVLSIDEESLVAVDGEQEVDPSDPEA